MRTAPRDDPLPHWRTGSSRPAASRPTGTTSWPDRALRANSRWIAFAMMDKPVEALQQSFLPHESHGPAVISCESPSSRPTARTTRSSPMTRARSPTFTRNSSRGATIASIIRSPSTAAIPRPTGSGATRAERACQACSIRPTAGCQNTNAWPYRAAGPYSAESRGLPEIHGHRRREFPRPSRAAVADRKPRLDSRKAAGGGLRLLSAGLCRAHPVAAPGL